MVSSYKAKMQEATASTRAFGDGVVASAKKNQQAFMAISLASGTLAIAFKSMFDQFDRGVDALRVGTGATGKALEDLEGSMGSVALTVTQGVGAVGVAMADLARRTGQTGEPLEDLTKSFLDLERITGEATATTIPTVTRLFGDWSIATENQAATMDKLFLASQNTGVGVGTLSALMVQFGSPLRQLGIDFDSAAAMFAKFEQEGVNIQTVLPGLRMALKHFAQDGREPAEALRETIAEIQNAASIAEANQIAFEVFGVRAGPDMAAAIREGRFELDDLIAAMNSGSDSIEAAAEDTMDLSDKLALLRNRAVMALGPFGEIGAVLFGALASIGPMAFGLSALSNAFKGSSLASSRFGTAVKGAAGPLGFLGVAAGFAVAGLMMAAEEAAQTRQAIEDLTQAVLSGSTTFDQWRADLVAAAKEQEVYDSQLADGLRARMDEIEATARSRVEMERRRQELIAGTISEEEYTAAAERHGLTEEQVAANIDAARRAIDAQTDATNEGAGATTNLAVALEDLQEEAQATQLIADLLTAALDALAGSALGVNEAELQWLDSLAQLKRDLREGAGTLNIHTQAGRDNQNAIRASIAAAIEHGVAVAEETGSVEEGARVIRGHIRALMDEAVEAGISRGAIRGYIDELNLTPNQIKTMIRLMGADEAIDAIEDIRTGLMGLPTSKRIEIIIARSGDTVPVVPHGGGRIGSSMPHRYHGGGMPGLRGDEVATILQRGEGVLNRRAMRRLGPGLLNTLNRMHAGGPVPGMMPNGRMVPGDAAGESNFLERQFAKLEAAMDDAASLIKEAIADGLDRQSSETAREMSRAIAEKQRRFDKMLEQARDHLADIREKMRGFEDAIRSGFSSGGDLLSGAAALGEEIKQAQMDAIQAQIDAAEEAGAAQPIIDALEAQLEALRDAVVHAGPEQMATFLAAKLKENQDFAAALRQLSELGLNTGMLAELAESGLEELPFMQALIAGGVDMIAAFNDTEAAVGSIGHELADDLGDVRFGDAIDAATRSITRLNERMAEVIDRLGDRLRKFLEAVQADTTAQKFNDLNAALDRIINSLDGGRGGNGESAAAWVAPTGSFAPAASSTAASVVNISVPVTVNGWVGTDQDIAQRVEEEFLRTQRRSGRLAFER